MVAVVIGGASNRRCGGWGRTSTPPRTHLGLAWAGEQVVDESESERNAVKAPKRFAPHPVPVTVTVGG